MTTVVLGCHYRDFGKLNRCLLRSSRDAGDGVQVRRLWRCGMVGMGSAYSEIEAVARSVLQADIVVYAHEDAVLPPRWARRVVEVAAELDRLDPDWALAGPFGTWLDDSGRQQYAGWVDDTFEKRRWRVGELPLRVDCLDGVLLIKRPDRPPAWDARTPGFHGYAEDLCLAAHAAGRGVWVVDFPIRHACSHTDLDQCEEYQQARAYVTRKWRGLLPVATSCGVWS